MMPFLSTHRPLSRRTLLRGFGAAVSLPVLEAMQPSVFARAASEPAPLRMLFVHLHLGFLDRHFTPSQAGRGYDMPKYLRELETLRDRFTVITGTSHPGATGGHRADVSFLTAAPDAASASFRNTISVDQVAAEHLGNETRYGYLTLGLDSRSASFTRSGADIPAIHKPSAVFAKLFLNGDAQQRAATKRRLEDGRSVIDFVSESTRRMSKRLGARDREKLDEYFTNIRETERRLQKSRAWEDIPKPRTHAAKPRDIRDKSDFISQISLMYDMMHLAIESDSTRVVTFNQPNVNAVLPLEGITQGYHSLSHHNRDPEKLRQLELVEIEQMRRFRRLLEKIAETREGEGSLLDRSMIMMGSIFGDANSHNTTNMPIILAGGGFNHGQHLKFDRRQNTPTANLYTSMLHHAGIRQVKRFATATGPLKGLAPASA